MFKLFTSIIILLVALSLIAAQCGSGAFTLSGALDPAAPAGPVIKVMEPVARASIPNGAVYMQLMNEGDTNERLISAESNVAEAVELHQTTIENDIMKMGPIKAVVIPAGGSATLEPGGMHMMLLGLKEELAGGDTFQLTLNFEHGDPQIIEVAVLEGMAIGHSDQEDHEATQTGTEEMAHDHEANEEMAAEAEAATTGEHSHDTGGHAASTALAMQPQVFKVVAAAYLMDTAGFHEMDDRLNEAGQIEASDAGTVNRVNSLLAVVDWPQELNPQAEALQAILTQYTEALSNDDVEAARPLATQAHEAQHDLSHAIGNWPGEIEGESGHEQLFQIVTAAYLMDTAGFHAMDDRLNEAGQIEASDAGTVNRVNRLLSVTDWPEELSPQAGELQTILTQYAAALSNDDLEAAKPLATQVHEVQHDLSHAIEHWVDHAPHNDHDMAAGEVDRHVQATIAAYLMDTAGFHDMDERLNEEGQIEAGDAGTVNRVNGLLAVVDWPEELNPQAEELQTILTQYAEALSNDDVEAAKPLATQVHEVQHDLSHAIGSWLAGDSEHGETESHKHEDEQGD